MSEQSPRRLAVSWFSSVSLSSLLSRLHSSTLTWMRQLRALQMKLCIQLSKQLRVSLTVVLLPLLTVLLIVAIRAIISSLNNANAVDQSVSHLPFTADVSPCQALNTQSNPDPSSWCTSLVYAPSNAFTDDVMTTVTAGLPGWAMGRDVLGFPDADSLYLDWARSLGHRDVAVVFSNSTFQYYQGVYANVGPNQVAYQLKWNTTRVSNAAQRLSPYNNPLKWRLAALQFLLESALSNAIARNVSQSYPLRPGQPVPYRPLPVAQASDIEFQFVQQVPSLTQSTPLPVNDGATATLGGPLFVMGAAITALLLIQLVAAEKQDSLLALMRMSQLHESAYWASYLFTFALLTLPAALIATGAGVLFGMQNFVNAAFSIHFIALWLLLIAMCAMGLLVAALWTQPRWVNLFSFLFLALCVMATFFFSNNAYYNYQQPTGAVFITGLLPFFHYGRIWSDIVRHSTYQTVVNTTAQAVWQLQASNQSSLQYPAPYFMGLPGQQQQDFAWSDIYAPQLVVSSSNYCLAFDSVCCDYWLSVGQTGVCFYSRSTQFSMWMLLLLAVAYSTAAWWLSQVSNDRGGGKPVYFPMRPQHWMETRRHARHSAEEEDSERQALADERDAIARERRLSAHEGSIRTLKLSKAYQQRTAVKELTMDMQPGSVTCLLGSNGAGKTSVVSVLSGLLRPTFGEAFVCGYSVREDLSHIHALIGVCPQDSVLYPQLSVLQHMRLFSALRGVPAEAVEETVERSLKLVNLWTHRLKRVDELSGGMKRRLCLSLALVGEPPVLLLDECTSGLDPMHKVELWSAIQRLKRGRVVLLTSHSLAEADFLADKVALLSDGRLVALGSPAQLRQQYGLGYQLQLLVSPQHVNVVVRQIKRYITSPQVLGTEGGAIVVGLKRHQLSELLSFMEWACAHRPPPEFDLPHYPGSPSAAAARDSGRHRSVIREWSLQQSTLEEVFLRFCNREQNVNSARLLDAEPLTDHLDGDEKHAGGDQEQPPSSPVSPPSPSLPSAVVSPPASYQPSEWDQVRAVLMKNWAMMRSERRSWVARLLVLVAVLLLLIYLVLNGGRSNICSQGYSSSYLPCDPLQFANAFFTVYSQITAPDAVVLPYGQQQGFTLPLWSFGQDSGNAFYNEQLSFVDSQNGSGSPFASWDIGQGVRGVLNVTALRYQTANGNVTFSNTTLADWGPLLAVNGATDVAQQAFLNELLVASHANDTPPSQPSCSNSKPPSNSWWFTEDTQARLMATWLYPWTALQVANSSIGAAGDGSRVAYKQVFWTNEMNQMVPSTAWNFTSAGRSYCSQSRVQYAGSSSQLYFTIHALSNSMMYTTINASSSYVAAQLQLGLHPWRQTAAPVINAAILGLTNLNFPGGLDSVTMAECVGLMAFVLMLLLPAFCDRILYERESQLFFMQRLAGMRVRNYWLASYAFDTAAAWVWSVCVVVLGYAMGLGLFVTSDVGLWFVLLLVWNHVIVGLAWFFAALFSRRRLAGIALHVLVMMVVVYATLMELYITGTLTYPKALLVFPPFAFVRALSLVIRDSGGLAALSGGSELSLALVALLLMGSGFMAVGWLLHTLQYRTWLSLLEQLPCYHGKRWRQRQAENEAKAEQQRMTVANQSLLSPASHRAMQEDEEEQASDAAQPMDAVDEDVQRESERVRILAHAGADEAQQDAAVLIVGLRKKYDKLGPMRLLRRCLGATNEADDQRRVDAVRELDLAIAYGECLALLGPNGAGKSTLLSVLSGLLLPSSGRALVNGHDVSHELPHVYSSLGICPQHDRLYDELTTRQHLLFYARLKGVPRAEERAAVYRLAKRVQLDGDAFDSRVRELSGGMRRRLSIAISLVGDPLVWLLDEPSTGLSAEARRSVWDIVSQQKQQRRCTLITTHMMEEADTLSTRVAILVKGRLRCIGPVAHLKQRFAQQLTLALTVDDRQPLDVDPNADPAQLHALVTAGQAGAYLQQLLRFVRQEVSETAELRAVQGQRLLFTLRLNGQEAGAGGLLEAAAQLRSVLPVFEALAARQERLRSELSVSSWDVSQASLDDVFVETVRRAKADIGSQQDDELEL